MDPVLPDHAPGDLIYLNDQMTINLPILIETRAIIQANSGGGKSWAIRRILEQSHGQVQQIIIDVEGAFRTLRERYGYVLLGRDDKDADYPIRPTNADLLARKFLEVRASVILDLYDFIPSERQQIVRHFLDALIDAPKELWHDCLVVLDEAHIFCPERGSAEAKPSVEALCSRGRARGFCAILATQRISKLGKDALAECNNKFIGRASLDRDKERSNAELEFPLKSQALKRLEPGEFYVFGPAISSEVQKVTIGPVTTTHPKAGSRRLVSSPPTPERIKEVLEALRMLPQEDVENSSDQPPGEVKGAQTRERSSHRELPSRRTLGNIAEKASPRGKDVLITQLRRENTEKDQMIQELRSRIDLLSTLNASSVNTGQFAGELSIDQAHVQRVVLAGEAPPDEVLQSATGVEQLRAELVAQLIQKDEEIQQLRAQVDQLLRQPDQTPSLEEVRGIGDSLTSAQEQKLKRLIKDIRGLSKFQRLLLTLLMSHEGNELSYEDISRLLRYEMGTVRNATTSVLQNKGLIARATMTQGYVSRFSAFCKERFPGADERIVRANLLQSISGE
jgi:hypothetical protein